MKTNLRWDSNAITSTVHLIGANGWPLCGFSMILAGADEGGAACQLCLRVAEVRQATIPKRRAT